MTLPCPFLGYRVRPGAGEQLGFSGTRRGGEEGKDPRGSRGPCHLRLPAWPAMHNGVQPLGSACILGEDQMSVHRTGLGTGRAPRFRLLLGVGSWWKKKFYSVPSQVSKGTQVQNQRALPNKVQPASPESETVGPNTFKWPWGPSSPRPTKGRVLEIDDPL